MTNRQKEGNGLTLQTSEDILLVEDVLDVQEYGVPELEKQNLSTRDALKELYKIQLYLYKSKKIRYEPCPICLTGHIGSGAKSKRKCRYCGSISCARCCLNKWRYVVANTNKIAHHSAPEQEEQCIVISKIKGATFVISNALPASLDCIQDQQKIVQLK